MIYIKYLICAEMRRDREISKTTQPTTNKNRSAQDQKIIRAKKGKGERPFTHNISNMTPKRSRDSAESKQGSNKHRAILLSQLKQASWLRDDDKLEMRVVFLAATLAVATCLRLRLPLDLLTPLTKCKKRDNLLWSTRSVDQPGTGSLFDAKHEESTDSDLFAQEVVESRYISAPKSALSALSQTQTPATAARQLTVHEKVYDCMQKLQPLLLNYGPVDGQFIAKLQLRLLTNMIKSDIQNRNDDVTILHKLPVTYLKALQWMNKICSNVNENQGGSASLGSILKLLQKKEGLVSLVRMLENDEKLARPAREIVEIKRKIERNLSEMITIIAAAKQCEGTRAESDLIFFAKPLIEKCNMHERHYALLLLSRALLAPTYRSERSWSNDKIDLSMMTSAPFDSIVKTFKEGMALFGRKHPSPAARMVFPFLLTAMRCHEVTTNVQLPMLPGRVQRIIHENEDSDTGLDTAAIKVCAFLSQCMEYDVDSMAQNSLVDFGDDLLLSLRRWLCDVSALYVINSDVKRSNDIITAYPEEIRKNTVAMELLLTDKTFCKGKKRDRETFVLLFAEVGRFVDIVLSSMLDPTVERARGMSNMKIKYGKMNMITCMKVAMSVYSTYQWLPRTNKLRIKIEKRLGLKNDLTIETIYGRISAVRSKRNYSKMKNKNMEKIIDYINNDDEDDTLFSSSSSFSSSTSRLYKPAPFLKKSDDSLWEPEESNNKRTKYIRSGREFKVKKFRSISETNPRQLMRELSRYLREIICEMIVDTETREGTSTTELAHNNPKFKEEVIYIYATWRRPQLLLDYYRMHSSSPELLRVYGRWLKALMAFSNETVDDIRRYDQKNQRHYRFIPSDLIDSWTDGKVRVVDADDMGTPMDFQPNNNFFQIPKRLIGSVVDGEDKVINVENGPGGRVG